MRLNYSISEKSVDDKFNLEKYLCPFCPTSSGAPGELTIATDKCTLKVAWTECTKGYANCCSIAELHAKLVITDSN